MTDEEQAQFWVCPGDKVSSTVLKRGETARGDEDVRVQPIVLAIRDGKLEVAGHPRRHGGRRRQDGRQAIHRGGPIGDR